MVALKHTLLLLTKHHVFHIGLVLVITALSYGNIFGNQFIGDDLDFIVSWPSIRSFNNVLSFFGGDTPLRHEGTYRPIRGIYYTVVYALSEQNPWGYHAFSLLVHLIVVLLVYILTTLLVKDQFVALTTALLFGLHPIHTEAITFVTASFDTASAIFLSASLISYCKYRQSTTHYWLVLSLCCGALAYGSNEHTLILPLLVLGYEYVFKHTSLRQGIRLCRLHILIALIYVFIRVFILNIGLRGSYVGDSLYFGLVTSIKSLLWYIYLTFIPVNLSFIHRLPGGITTYNYHDQTLVIAQNQSWWEPIVLATIALVSTLLIIGWKIKKNYPAVSFGIFWFFIALLPVSNLIPTAVSFSERYAYLASYGYCLILGWVCVRLTRLSRFRVIGLITITVISLFFSVKTFTRNLDWRDSVLFWEQLAQKFPDHLAAQVILAQQYQVKGMDDLAIAQYYQVLKLKPDYAVAYHRIGQIHHYFSRFAEAIAAYDQALSQNNQLTETKHNASLVNFLYAKQLYDKGNKNLATQHLQKSLELNPQNLDALGLYRHISQK